LKEENKEEGQKVEDEQKEVAESAEESEIEGTAGEMPEEVEEKEKEEAQEKVEEAEEIEEEKPVTIEEEAKPPPKEEKPEEEEIVEERVYTIPLGRAWIAPPNKRAPRAMRIIKSFVTKHMKLGVRREGEEEEEPERLVIDNGVNEVVWRRGIEKPPRKIRVRVAKDKEGNVTVYLAEGD